MSHIQQITLDLIPNGEMPILYASQYDAGRSFRANIVERKIPYTLDGTELISLTVRKGDGNLVTMDIANTFAGKTYIDFLSTEQMTAIAGSNFGELHLESNGESIGTLNFYLMVEPAADEGGITSESEINNLRRQVNEMVDEEMGDYLLKTEAEETYATITDLETLSGVVDTKASASDLETLAGVVDTKASKTYVDSVADTKADKSTTYTKTQVDDKLSEKANADDVYKKTETYSKTETDNLVSPKADKTYVDTQLQTKANASDVYTKAETDNKISALIDDTQTTNSKVWSSKKTYDEIANILPTGNASGSIANFNTSLALPMEIVADVNATQEAGTPTPNTPKAISGVSAVNLVKCGKNLFDKSTFVKGRLDDGVIGYASDTTSMEITDSGVTFTTIANYRGVVGGLIRVKPSTSYYFNFTYSGSITLTKSVDFYDFEGNWLNRLSPFSFSFTTPNNCGYIRIAFQLHTSGTATISNIFVNYPSTEHAYASYNPNGSTTLINLNSTYYGGQLMIDKSGKRKIKPNKGEIIIDGSQTIRVASQAYIKSDACDCFVVCDDIFPRFGPAYQPDNFAMCEKLEPVKITVWNTVGYPNCLTINTNQIHLNIANDLLGVTDYTQETPESVSPKIIAYLRNNPIKVVFNATNSAIIDLPDGEPINSLVGVNNVYADSGDCEVTYKKSIDDAIAELQALILS